MVQAVFTREKILTGLMTCTILTAPSFHAHAATDSKAVTSWQVSRVASVSQGSYCAMAQKFDNQSILTFAQNSEGQYSLAIESPKAKFDAAKDTEVVLSVKGGDEETYNARVQSQNAIVIGLGKGEDVVGKLKKSGVLHVKVGNSQTVYQFNEYGAGQKDMGACLAGIQASPEKTATNNKADKIENTEPAAGETPAEPSVEGLLAARPSTSDNGDGLDKSFLRDDVEPVKAVSKNAPKPADIDIIETTMDKEMSDLREENARLKRSLAESRKAYEDQQVKQSGSAVDEMKEKLAALKDENSQLNTELADARKMTKAISEDEMKLSNVSDELKRAKQLAETLKSENATLRNQISIAAKTGDKETQQASQMSLQMADLKTENAKLKLEVDSLSKLGGGITPDVLAVQQSLKGLEDRIAIMRSENADLRQQLSDAKTSGSSADMGGDEKLRAQLRDLHVQVETLQKEKVSLLASIEKMQKDTEVSQLKAAGGSWDLEQATRRYQESQREIRRLGALIDDSNARCQAEKKDIEYMLFDPEIAKSAQISMLNNLEDQIAEKDKAIKLLEAKQAEKQQPSPELLKKIADMEKQAVDDAATISSVRKELTSVQATAGDAKRQQELLAQKESEINSLQTKIVSLQSENQKVISESQQSVAAEIKKASDSQKTVIDSLTSQLKAASDKSIALEAQLAEVKTKQGQDAQAVVSSKAEVLAQTNAMAALNSQLKSASDKVALLEGQLAQAKMQAQQARLAAQIESAAGGNSMPAAPSVVPYQNVALTSQAPMQAVGVKFMSNTDIANLLASTGLSPRNGVQAIQGGDPNIYRAFGWKTDSMFGSAELRKVAGNSALPEIAKQYLSRAKSRCQGDFAADESSLPAAKGVVGYEIACVGNNNTSSASVLFSYADGIVTTIAHEGRAEAMDMVMDTRDKLAVALAR